ncbi:MAG: hypothetical protein KKD44_27835 [Proteobacteria bacterium]|nr:hypothetical protein [Pseudomonadota bacterium]
MNETKADKIIERVGKNIKAIERDLKKLVELNHEYLEVIDALAKDMEDVLEDSK